MRVERSLGFEAGAAFDDVVGAALHLVVDAAEVFAEDADADELHAADEKDERDERGEAGLGDLDPKQAAGHEEQREAEADQADHEAGEGDDAQREFRKADEAVDGVADKSIQTLAGLAGGAIVAVVGRVDPAKADPGAKAGEETVAFGKAVEGVDGDAIEEPEGAGVGLDGKIGEPAEAAVEEIEAEATEAAFLARAADGEDDLGALAPFGEELGDVLGRILQIGVHGDDGVGGRGGGEAGFERGLVAEIAGELDEFEAGILVMDGGDDVAGAVAAAVVDEDDGPVDRGLFGEDEAEPPAEFREDGLFVPDGDDDRDVGHAVQRKTLYLIIAYKARKPSRQPIFLPSA